MANKRPTAAPAPAATAVNVPRNKGNTQSATHVHASSLAVPIQSELAHLETKLTSLSLRISPLLQRDVILSRIDDTDPYRMELETSDSSFAPMQRARLQSRLHVRFQSDKIEMRVYSQGQGGGANKSSDMVNIRSLVIAEINSDEDENTDYSTMSNGAIKRNRKMEANTLPDEINAGGDHWHQLTLAMGWVPHHTVIRSGHCFTIRHDKTMSIQVNLFHLLKLNEEAKPMILERLSNTRILQAIVTIPTVSFRTDQGTADLANLSDRANGEMVKLQEALRGLVDLSKDID